MKTIKALLAIVLAISISSIATAQSYNYKLDGPFTATKTFKVSGTCEMCKHRIESAVNKLPGVWSSWWDINSQTLLVKYNRVKVDAASLKKLVAAAGHDTDQIRAANEAYAKLPDCCHYQRNS